MKAFKTLWREALVGVLVLGNVMCWYAVASETRGGVLTVNFLDVGQGDSIFIDGPNGVQILIDGGKGNAVLRELSKVMPFYDRSIDVIIATHPDQDHIEGLLGVLNRYSALAFIEPDLRTTKPFQIELEQKAKKLGLRSFIAKTGQKISLGKGAYLEVIYPNVEVSHFEKDTNAASVVAILRYGNTSFIFTGDLPKKQEDQLTSQYGRALDVDVLKVGHHGSRTSSCSYFLATVTPKIAVISAGKNNRYGHPHKEALDNLVAIGAEIKNTANIGRVTIKSDGGAITLEE